MYSWHPYTSALYTDTHATFRVLSFLNYIAYNLLSDTAYQDYSAAPGVFLDPFTHRPLFIPLVIYYSMLQPLSISVTTIFPLSYSLDFMLYTTIYYTAHLCIFHSLSLLTFLSFIFHFYITRVIVSEYRTDVLMDDNL